MTHDPVCGMEMEEATAPASSAYEDNTYYFCSESCQEVFDVDPERFVALALAERRGEATMPG